jgi:hypothetical protein
MSNSVLRDCLKIQTMSLQGPHPEEPLQRKGLEGDHAKLEHPSRPLTRHLRMRILGEISSFQTVFQRLMISREIRKLAGVATTRTTSGANSALTPQSIASFSASAKQAT